MNSHKFLQGDTVNLENLGVAIAIQKARWDNDEYYFDEDEAIKFVKFSRKLKLDKGKKGAKTELLFFQFTICTDILCVKRKSDGLRRFREAHINIPRKNGKSFLVGIILTYMYFFKTEYGAEYIITANNTKQASLLFATVKHFIVNSPLVEHCKITESQRIIYREDENSYLRVLSSDASGGDSYADLFFCMDEIHEAPDQKLYDKLKTGQGIFDEPLGITITTASNGQDPLNLEYELFQYSKQIEKGEIEDDTFYYAIFQADEGCDVLDEEQWYKANPALGKFRKLDDLKTLAKRASKIKTREASFRRYFLNQHVALVQDNAINMHLWSSALRNIAIEELNSLNCVAGLDVGGTSDLTAYVKVYHDETNDKYIVYPLIFTPKNTVLDREERDKVKYSEWIAQGHVITLEGSYINIHEMIKYIKLDKGRVDAIAFDDWGAYDVKQSLEEDFDVINVRQGYKTMTPAIKTFENWLIDGKIIIHNNPCFTWMAKNVVAQLDDAGNIKYSKKLSKNKIDGIIAMVMALFIANTYEHKSDLNEHVKNNGIFF